MPRPPNPGPGVALLGFHFSGEAPRSTSNAGAAAMKCACVWTQTSSTRTHAEAASADRKLCARRENSPASDACIIDQPRGQRPRQLRGGGLVRIDNRDSYSDDDSPRVHNRRARACAPYRMRTARLTKSDKRLSKPPAPPSPYVSAALRARRIRQV